MIEETRRSQADDIEIRLAATLNQLPILRSVATSIAMRADFDIDAISDLELAVDEACSSLMVRAVPESTLVCRFTVGTDEIGFVATVTSDQAESPSTATFGWRVLDTLADSARTWVESTQDSAYHVHVALSKQRQVRPG